MRAGPPEDVLLKQPFLVDKLQPSVKIILIEEVHRRFKQVSIRVAMTLVIAAPDQTRSPVAALPRAIVRNRGREPPQIARCERFRIDQMSIRELHRPIRRRCEPDSPTPGIQFATLNILAVFIRLCAMK